VSLTILLNQDAVKQNLLNIKVLNICSKIIGGISYKAMTFFVAPYQNSLTNEFLKCAHENNCLLSLKSRKKDQSRLKQKTGINNSSHSIVISDSLMKSNSFFSI
jgi:hypothetical protein